MEKSISLSRMPVAPRRRRRIGPAASIIAASALIGLYIGMSNILIGWF